MHWLNFIDDLTAEPVFVNLETVTRFEADNNPYRVYIRFTDGASLRVRCSMQDIAVNGSFPIQIIEAPVS